ncbi:MAG: hypothetical protein WC208_14970 [Gallionella sp.]|jgi:hypothetical protein
MKLTVFGRLMLLNILPNEGNFLTLKIVNQLQQDLSFSEEELKRLDIKQVDGNVTWNRLADEPKEVTIGEKATDIIVSALKKLNDTNKLTLQHYELYEKFIEGGK